jgi:chromate transporter
MRRLRARELLKMFWGFFRIGAFTIGGGYAMLPLMEREFVEKQKWVNPEEMVDIIALVQSLPGVIAVNTSVFIGYKLGGLIGAVVALAGVILPSILIILIIAVLLLNIQGSPVAQRAFAGVRAGVAALIAIAAARLSKRAIRDTWGIVLAVAAFIAIVFFDVHAIYAILAGAFLGYILYGVLRVQRRAGDDR